jgi:hypothetical protein
MNGNCSGYRIVQGLTVHRLTGADLAVRAGMVSRVLRMHSDRSSPSRETGLLRLELKKTAFHIIFSRAAA